jgi:3-deoxy-7-phosphoheptulonate synthase
VIPLAASAVAVGADGLIIELHPNPEVALCDKDQALCRSDLEDLRAQLEPLTRAMGRRLGQPG